MNRKVIFSIVAVIVIAIAWKPLNKLYDQLHVALPDYPQTKATVWLDQKLSKEQRGWFYHADQGTRTFHIPFEWFAALEQPTLAPLIWQAEWAKVLREVFPPRR